ncbi:diadenosine tetraphosphate hydrolase [Streptomyces sp. NPDC002346]
MTGEWRTDRIGAALRGENPTVLRRLESGFGVIGDVQFDPAFRRVDLEILGNTDPLLHAHVWPRFEWEPADLVGAPVWLYPRDRWHDEQFRLGPQDDLLRDAIGSELDELRSTA